MCENQFSEAERQLLHLTPSKQTSIRNHYRNTDYHPSIIVRAYRKIRTWLTDHFVIAEHRLENIYSISIIITFAFLGILFLYLDYHGGAAGGLDDIKIDKKQKN